MLKIFRSTVFDTFGFRLFPLFWGVVFISIPVFSAVNINLWVIHGWPATAMIITYGSVLALLAAFPYRYNRLHAIGAALAVLVLVGRAGGFFELALERGEWSLTAAILERLGYATALLFWHRAGQVRVNAQREAVPASL